MPRALSGSTCIARLAMHLAYDGVGPHHCGLFGRLAGSVPDFLFGCAMKNLKIVWSDKTLDRLLAQP
jgi:cytochrome c